MKVFAAALLALCLCASVAKADDPAMHYKTAIFAGGCFWCMESDFDDTKGVVKTTSGYMGGQGDNPSYAQVSRGTTGYLESVQVTYDPSVISYDDLLTVFWQNIDPLDQDGQFCDKGTQYHAAIFYSGDEERHEAEESLKKVEAKFNQPIMTALRPANTHFWPAEEEHQNYHEKNPVGYGFYRNSCGRDARTKELWGDDKK